LLKFGEVSYDDTEKKTHYLYIENGFLEVNENNISIISDKVIRGEEIDKIRVKSRLSEVEKIIKSASSGDIGSEELKMLLEENRKLISQKKISDKI
jgi:F0F1-type ATP synthase epsilon subunit